MKLAIRFGPQFWRSWITLGASMAIAAGMPIAAKTASAQLVVDHENRLELRAGFQAFLAVYELTREPRYLDWAAHALDVALTYTVLWDIDLPAGRLRDHQLKTRVWTIVSAQNQHLDVYAVPFTPEIWRTGDYLGRDDLKRLAAVMYRSCGLPRILLPRPQRGETPPNAAESPRAPIGTRPFRPLNSKSATAGWSATAIRRFASGSPGPPGTDGGSLMALFSRSQIGVNAAVSVQNAPRARRPSCFRQVLECGSPLPLCEGC